MLVFFLGGEIYLFIGFFIGFCSHKYWWYLKCQLKISLVSISTIHLAKLKYFTNLDFPEIYGDFPYNHHHLGVPSVVWGRLPTNGLPVVFLCLFCPGNPNTFSVMKISIPGRDHMSKFGFIILIKGKIYVQCPQKYLLIPMDIFIFHYNIGDILIYHLCKCLWLIKHIAWPMLDDRNAFIGNVLVLTLTASQLINFRIPTKRRYTIPETDVVKAAFRNHKTSDLSWYRSGKIDVFSFDYGTLPETDSKSPWKRNGWKTMNFPFGAKGLFSGAMAVSFREVYKNLLTHQPSIHDLSNLKWNETMINVSMWLGIQASKIHN